MVDSLLNATALREMLVAAKLCIDTEKDSTWTEEGRLGFPAALLLLTFIDSAGFLAFIKGTADDKGKDTTFGLAFEKYIDSAFHELENGKKKKLKKILCNKYRGYLVHQAGLSDGTSLSIDSSKEIITKEDSGHTLHLIALYENCSTFYDRNIELLNKKSAVGKVGII